jgi:citrate lyase subunit beta/citryl-CoA lyase
MRDLRLRRSMLITPGNQPERIAKSATLGADAVVIDLEDGVAPDGKAAARRHAVEALAHVDFGRRERLVRINAVGTAAYQADMDALRAADLDGLDSIFVPKVESADQIRELASRLDELDSRGRRVRPIEIVATIETPRGLLRALEIADASARTSALFFGSGDYTAATGSAVTERSLAAPRAIIVAAAAAVGAQAIDAAYFVAVKDVAATRADALIARELGFSGKLVFHPSQIAPANEVFTPSIAEIARAGRIIAAYDDARRCGRGTAVVDGEFIAVDIAKMAERVLATARLAGLDAA